MANLITQKQKEIIKVDYLFRFISVILFMVSLLGVFILAYTIPYYFALFKKEVKVSEQFGKAINVVNRENINENVSTVVKRTLEEMKAVELYNKTSLLPSVYFTKIIESKNSNIKITKLLLDGVKKGRAQFIVGGTSISREGLVSFIENLKSKGGFASVETPVSDFAKDSDIIFTLNLATPI